MVAKYGFFLIKVWAIYLQMKIIVHNAVSLSKKRVGKLVIPLHTLMT